jgi:hypothetical protein
MPKKFAPGLFHRTEVWCTSLLPAGNECSSATVLVL